MHFRDTSLAFNHYIHQQTSHWLATHKTLSAGVGMPKGLKVGKPHRGGKGRGQKARLIRRQMHDPR